MALRYGPLIYCVESVEQNVDGFLQAGLDLRTDWKADLLGGVQIIEGVWADGSPLTAIPYYARNNRAPDAGRRVRSLVWLKEQR